MPRVTPTRPSWSRAKARALENWATRPPNDPFSVADYFEFAAAGGQLAAYSRYSADGEASFFADLIRRAAANQVASAVTAPRGLGPTASPPIELTGDPHPRHGSLAEARARLETVERRDLTTGATDGGNFSAPAHVAQPIAVAERTKGALMSVLPKAPLPDRGMTLEVPRVTTGATAAAQSTENTAIDDGSDTFTEALLQVPVGMVSGQLDVSQQLFDRADPAFDVIAAAELGAAMTADLERQLISGAGSNGELRGLTIISNSTGVTYTDGTPTAAEVFNAIGRTVAASAGAYGGMPDTLVLHPRRAAHLATNIIPLEWPVPNVAMSAGVPTTDGSSTNQDEIYVFPSSAVTLHLGVPRFRVAFDTAGSGTMTPKVTLYRYASLVVRSPETVAILSGTGLVTPW